jgi:radial spoke head protein 1
MSDEEDDEETKYTIVYEGDETIYKAVDRDGIATATFENGDTYVGMYKDQKRNGAGVYTYTSKNMKYEGEYLENKKEGHGRMTYQDGGIFEGGWKDNERHGMGTYFYPNGDSYSGEWKNGKKNGIGKYVFADNGSTMSGTWVANRCVSGVWGMSDRSRYVGRFANNVPSGGGMFIFANKNKQAGVFRDNQWYGDRFIEPSPTQQPPAPSKASPTTWARRKIDKALIVVDHFEGISQLPELVAGVPNFRQATKMNVYGGGQPTLSGIQRMMETLEEDGASKLYWISLRDTPVCYVSDLSFTAARREAIARPMVFDDVKQEELPLLDTMFSTKIQRDIRATGGLMSYWKLALADVEEDVKRVEIVLEVDETKEDEEEEEEKGPGNLPVMPVADIFKPEGWTESNDLDITYSRMNIHDEKIMSVTDMDAICLLAREAQAGSAIFFQDQGGFARTTCGMVVAGLVRLLFEEPEDGDDDTDDKQADQEEEEDESDEDPDEDPEDREARHQARALRRAEAKRKALEEEEEEILPDYKKGEFSCIMELVRAIGPTGVKIKEEVDMVITRCAALVNLQEVIIQQQASNNLSKGQNCLERYFWFILFMHYLKSNFELEFETSFEQWLQEDSQVELLALLGTRQEGPLAEFNFT